MSGFITAEGLVIPVGSDYYDYTGDIKRLSSSIRSVVSAANDAAVTTIISGMTTDGRTPSDASPLFVYNQNRAGLQWVGTAGVQMPLVGAIPFGHMGKTNGFQTVTSAATVVMGAGQVLRAGMTFNSANNALVVPIAGLYRVTCQSYFSGAATGTNLAWIYQNAAQTGINTRFIAANNADVASSCTGVIAAAANDQFSVQAQGPQSAWGGSSGYSGFYLEVEYVGQ